MTRPLDFLLYAFGRRLPGSPALRLCQIPGSPATREAVLAIMAQRNLK
jgi:hypothetical protein